MYIGRIAVAIAWTSHESSSFIGLAVATRPVPLRSNRLQQLGRRFRVDISQRRRTQHQLDVVPEVRLVVRPRLWLLGAGQADELVEELGHRDLALLRVEVGALADPMGSG
jgi:hypothetical protein